jgi:hypothetical protein
VNSKLAAYAPKLLDCLACYREIGSFVHLIVKVIKAPEYYIGAA